MMHGHTYIKHLTRFEILTHLVSILNFFCLLP